MPRSIIQFFAVLVLMARFARGPVRDHKPHRITDDQRHVYPLTVGSVPTGTAEVDY